MDLFTAFYIKLLTYNDFFDSVSTAMGSWTGRLQAIGVGIIIFCVAVAGVMYMLGEEMSRKAKQWIFRIIVGGVILFSAGIIGDTIRGLTGEDL
ncbi:conjugal transfer protein TrbC [[Bacillus thuringiensis] serovar konkukian]|nr:TrbC/VirB2 family protein [Bacillus thuringiensis]MED1305165.1 TrbC/VirB2 family protein [Bacillus pacificus]OUB17537.1 conjugal transfer protein TrbC [[Bacillus thuringiensis] serovar konkukian]